MLTQVVGVKNLYCHEEQTKISNSRWKNHIFHVRMTGTDLCFRTNEFHICIISFSSFVTSTKSSSICSQIAKAMIKGNILLWSAEQNNYPILPFYPQSQQYHHQLRLHYHDPRRLVPMPLATMKCKCVTMWSSSFAGVCARMVTYTKAKWKEVCDFH
jgi:hypothetical protein